MTFDQHIASDPAISAWVSASAGTGKTKVLTDRVLRLLLAGAEPSKILCITYTKAASAEMEQRIEQQLGAWAIADDGSLHDSLALLIGSPPDAYTITLARQLFANVLDSHVRIRIQTIHGFCQSVLTRFPLEAGVPPHFTRIDEHASRELLASARLELFRRTQNKDACAQALSALSAIMAESSLKELIENIAKERRKFIPWFSTPEKTKQLREYIYKILNVSPDTTMEKLTQNYFQYSQAEERELRQVCSVLIDAKADADKKTGEAINIWLQKRENSEVYALSFLTQEHKPRARLYTKESEKKLPNIKQLLEGEQKRVMSFLDALKSLRVAEATLHMITLAEVLLELYSKQKSLHCAMDYDDLILHTVQLFEREGVAPWVLYKLDGGIDHLLVDEAQDTSPEQWKLVEKLAEEFFVGAGARPSKRTLFIVGDEKQSIFGFQGAEPLAFDRMQRLFAKRTESAGATFKRVRLALSYRSTTPVLQAVDAVFTKEDARDGLVFTEQDISHGVHRKGAAGRVELWPLIENSEAEELESWHIAEKHSYAQRPEVMCANEIADTIAVWLAQGRELPSQGRAVRAGDIMILVQSRGVFASAMLRVLRQKGVPVAGADRLILTEHIAVQDCIALGKFLLLPQDDLTLAVVLKSPFIGLSEEALFELAHDRGKEFLWQRLRANKKYTKAQQFLSELLAKTDYLAPHELFLLVLEKYNGRKKLAERLGTEIDDPINEFLSLAMQYERLYAPSLQGFLQWLESDTVEIKRDMEKGKDEVRIMTVHGAKGLQAPIVFLPDTTRMPRYENEILWTEGEVRIPLWSPFSEYNDKYYGKLKELHKMEAEREQRRLLYVAMTRAEDELYICGWKGNKAISEKSWYELIKRGLTDKWQMDGLPFIVSSEQIDAVRVNTASSNVGNSTQKLPAWSHAPAKNEPALPKPLTPSHMAGAANKLGAFKDPKAIARGVLLHRLLQYLPDIEPQRHSETIRNFMIRYAKEFQPEEQVFLEQEVLRILNHSDFSAVFGPGSSAEVPVSGVIYNSENKPVVISGQIDRLLVSENDVYIIDYKTSREVPSAETEIPRAYLYQMEAYRKLISQIYPEKTVHCALLWTSRPLLMVLSNAILASLAA